MPSSARLTDVWSGICCCHPPIPCIGMTGPIITASANKLSGSLGSARLTDTTQGGCGHTGTIVSGSSVVFVNSLQKATIGSAVTGCNIGNVVTGNPNHCIGLGASGAVPPLSMTVTVKGITVTYNESDFGNVDDEEAVDDGLNIYPPLQPGQTPTPRQLYKSQEFDVAPTNTIEIDSTAATTTTPPVSCLLAPTPAPDSFQLSANVQLGDVSTNTLLSHTSVRIQAGLSYQDIICNLQGVAENILEPLIAQYGNIQVITSGFRIGSGSSQHERGQAVDIQYLGFSNEQVFGVAQFIKDYVNYDQLILEYGGNKPWLHVSFNRAGNRDVSVSNKFGTRISAGNYVWRELRYMT